MINKFTYTSLCSGVGGFETALNSLGGECVFASEIDKYAQKSYTALYGDDVLHGDITKVDARNIPKHDLLVAGIPCFVAGTLVDTDKGLVPIEDVNESHSVLTHENRYKKVVTPMSKIADRVLSIRVTGSIPTEVTFEHPYWVTERKDVWDNSKRRKVRTFSEPKWVDAQDLIPGTHYVGYAADNREENPLGITDEEAYIIGRYIADGYLNTSPRSGRVGQFNRKVILCIGKDKLKDFVYSVGNSYHFGLYEDVSVYRCTATSQRLVDLCELAGRGAENKVFPVEILSLPKNLLKRVVEGYLSGDGSYKNGVHSATTVSKHLAISLSKAVRKVYDVQASITHTNRPPTCVIEGRTVRQRNTYRVQIIKEPQKETSTRIDGIIFSPVKSVEVIEKDVEVYNIEVEEDNSYTANGQTVHNCQSFSVNGKRGGFEDARGTLFFDVARVAQHHQPKAILIENVKGLIGHPSKVDFEGALEEHLIGGNLLWPKEQLTKSTSSFAKKNAESYLRMILQKSWDLQLNKSTTSLKNTADSAIEVGETFLKHGLTKKLKSLVEQILQITKKYSSCPEGQTQQFVCNVEDLALNLRKSYFTENTKLEDMFSSETMVDTLKELEKSFKNILEENSMKEKSSTTLTESRMMTELKTCMFAVIQLNIIRFIVKDSTLLENLSKRELFISTEGKENTFTIPTLDKIVKTLNDIGYRVDFEVLNSKYFGVPQNRERIFLIAVREDLVKNEVWSKIEGKKVSLKGKQRIIGYEGVKTFNFNFPQENSVTTTIGDILESDVDESFYLPDNVFNQLIHTVPNRLDNKLLIKEAVKKGYSEAHIGDAVNFRFPTSKTRRGRVGANKLANTIEAAGVNQGVVTKDLKIRRFTPLEYWRLQSFTDEQHKLVELAGLSNNQRYKQAGNAVTVNVVKAIGEELLKYIL